MVKRQIGVFVTSIVTIVAMVQVVRYLSQEDFPLVVISLAVFWTARLGQAVLDRVLFPVDPMLFYEDVLRDLVIYSMLALVTTGAIWLNQEYVGTQISPLGPAIVVHILSLLFRRAQN